MMLDECLVLVSVDNDPAIDEHWLSRCTTVALGQEGELCHFCLFDTETRQSWHAIRAPVESPAACQRLERDYRLALDPAWAVLPAAYVRSAEGPLLVYPTGLSVADLIDQGRLCLERFLHVAVNAATTLAKAHQGNAVHGALRPRQLLIGNDGQVRIGGFRADASDIPSTQPDSWTYLAPEQVCPHGTHTDRRSDIYALAAILYQLLLGQLPLAGRDIQHWRQLHAGVQPRPAGELDPTLPRVISQILGKALAKEPDARYQSAEALAIDLAHCQRQWAAHGDIAPFTPGCADLVPAAGERLYGRDGEQQTIARLLDSLRRDNTPQGLLVNGATGMGKSSLVHTSLKVHANGYWASGKCNSLEQAVPYAPWIEILGTLATQLLARNSSDLDATARDIRQRLQGRGQLLSQLAPDLQLILGPSADFSIQASRLTLEKEHRAIVEVLEAFSSPGQPLAIFLDDLQWADDASRYLLQALLAKPPRGLLLILASRSDGSAMSLIDLPATPTALRCQSLTLQPLPVAAIVELIVTRYHVNAAEALPVAERVHAKTAGNPFFVRQILRAMVEDRLFVFDTHAMRWSWSIDAVAHHRYADNVADLMVQRLTRLPSGQRELLRLAAAAGGRFDVALLRRLAGQPDERLDGRLKALREAGFLASTAHGLAFAHDRVQEAAYQLTPEHERSAQHARIAQAMWQAWADSPREGLFELANQLQRAATDRFTAQQCATFLALLLRAATQARDAASHEQAAGYLQAAHALQQRCPIDARQAFTLACMATECDMLLSRTGRAEAGIAACHRHARTALERATAHRLAARLNTLRSDYPAAIDEAMRGLQLLGIELNHGDEPQPVERQYATVRRLIEQRGRHCLEALPRATSEPVEVAIALLATLSSSFFVRDEIRFLHLSRILELSLAHGVAPGSTYGLAWFGVMCAERFAAYHDGHAYCLAALKLIERHGFECDLTSTLLALDQVSAWTSPMEFARRTALEAIDSANLSGDLAMACYACCHAVSDALVMGKHLDAVNQEVERGLATVRRYGYRDVEFILLAQQAFVADLCGAPATHDERNAVRLHDTPSACISSSTTRFFQSLFAGMAAFYLGDIGQATAHLEQADGHVWAVPAHINLADFHLFQALTLGSPQAPGTLEAKLERLARLRLVFSQWAQFNPVTFRNKVLLIEGLIARLQGDGLSAIRCFDQAQIAATAAGFIHEQAIAHEQLAEVCIPSGLISGANLHLRIARDCFHLWGATGKVRQLETLHPFLRTQPIQETFCTTSQANLDLEAGIEAARALSEETLLEGLIETLMGQLTQHAGADHGALLIVSGAEYQMAALADIDDAGLRVSMEQCQKFMTQAPRSIINATLRTKKTLLLHDAQVECPEAFRQDLHARGARSVLCLPLVIQGVLIGLVYLENCLVPNLFGGQRLAMLEILAAQAAVSLQTAKFYTRLAEEHQTRAQMEAELRRSRAELARSAHLQVMNELSASIAHEISQPLLGIASNAAASLRWLRRDTPDLDEAMAGLEDIRADSERAANIVRALRSLAKQTPMQFKTLKLDDLILQVIRLASADARKSAVKLQAQLDAGVTVLADPVQIQQLVFNLLTNALEALAGYRGDGVVRISSCRCGDEVQVQVDDNGPGIDAQDREQVFEVFHTTKPGGLGMGLAICMSVVQAHGGRLQALDSELGGCCIRFSVPVAGTQAG
jgi:predicted ATPase/signal transduction histidine kinase